MADVPLVSQTNLDTLLKGLKSAFLSKINTVTVVKNAETVLNNKATVIITNGTGTNVLADNGTYKSNQSSNITTLSTNTNTTWNTLKIQQDVNGHYYPNIPEYNNIVSKITPIINNGDGTLFLNDKGSYVDVQLYREMSTDEINNFCTDIEGGL